jgi:hypothetical protein
MHGLVFLILSSATASLPNFVGTPDPLPKTISCIFIKHNTLTKIQNHANIIKWERKIREGTINSVSYEVLKHVSRVLRYGREQIVVNVIT